MAKSYKPSQYHSFYKKIHGSGAIVRNNGVDWEDKTVKVKYSDGFVETYSFYELTYKYKQRYGGIYDMDSPENTENSENSV